MKWAMLKADQPEKHFLLCERSASFGLIWKELKVPFNNWIFLLPWKKSTEDGRVGKANAVEVLSKLVKEQRSLKRLCVKHYFVSLLCLLWSELYIQCPNASLFPLRVLTLFLWEKLVWMQMKIVIWFSACDMVSVRMIYLCSSGKLQLNLGSANNWLSHCTTCYNCIDGRE